MATAKKTTPVKKTVRRKAVKKSESGKAAVAPVPEKEVAKKAADNTVEEPKPKPKRRAVKKAEVEKPAPEAAPAPKPKPKPKQRTRKKSEPVMDLKLDISTELQEQLMEAIKEWGGENPDTAKAMHRLIELGVEALRIEAATGGVELTPPFDEDAIPVDTDADDAGQSDDTDDTESLEYDPEFEAAIQMHVSMRIGV